MARFYGQDTIDQMQAEIDALPATIDAASTADRDRANHTGSQSLDSTTDSAERLAMTAAERTKLGGVASGATANATNAQLRDRATHTGEQPQSSVTGLTAALGAKADLVDGVVPAGQLPSFVDDVLEFANLAAFPATGESGKIYTALDSNKTYRWSGSVYVVLSDSVALGETAATAYRGDRGKTAYDHSQTGGNPHGTTAGDVGAEPALDVPSQAEAEAGTATTGRKWTAQRVWQAIAAALPSTSVGRQVLNAATPADARAALGIVTVMPWSAKTPTLGAAGSYRVRTAMTLSQAVLWCDTAPVGSPLTVRLQRSTDASATWTTLATLEVAAGSTVEDVEALTTTLNVGDRLRAFCDAIGSTTPAGFAALEVYGT